MVTIAVESKTPGAGGEITNTTLLTYTDQYFIVGHQSYSRGWGGLRENLMKFYLGISSNNLILNLDKHRHKYVYTHG